LHEQTIGGAGWPQKLADDFRGAFAGTYSKRPAVFAGLYSKAEMIFAGHFEIFLIISGMFLKKKFHENEQKSRKFRKSSNARFSKLNGEKREVDVFFNISNKNKVDQTPMSKNHNFSLVVGYDHFHFRGVRGFRGFRGEFAVFAGLSRVSRVSRGCGHPACCVLMVCCKIKYNRTMVQKNRDL